MMNKSWDRASMRFASAGYLARQRMLSVSFENGDHFLVAVESVLPATGNGASSVPPDWSRMQIGETGDVLEVPARGDTIEIPWDRIRSVADSDFRAHLTERAVERARHLGMRIRAMRLETGLTRAALAEKVELTREILADMEAGKIEPRIEQMEKIAVALGKRLRDFGDDTAERSLAKAQAN
jgi:DNA-binding XRE family transcriptional regulator